MERVFAPWVDMEGLMRENGIPLFSLESYRPVKEFHGLAFTLQYEMSYNTPGIFTTSSKSSFLFILPSWARKCSAQTW